MARSAPPQAPDAVLPGRLAELLADHGEEGLTEALDLVVAELGLRSAVLRDPASAAGRTDRAGALRAVAGEAVHAVPTMRVVPTADGSAVELPLRAAGRDVGTLTVVGARPSLLPVLRASAAVLALGLTRPVRPSATSADLAADLLAAAEADADEAADRLHDGAVQALVVARYAADAAARGGDVTAARDAVQAALVELRRTLWHLRPRGTDGGLPAALALLSGRLTEAGAEPLGYVVDEPVAAALPTAAVTLAYRLVQATALPAPAAPVRIAVRRDGNDAVVDIDGGAAIEDLPRWATKAKAVGGSLTTTDGRLRLSVPLSPGTKANP